MRSRRGSRPIAGRANTSLDLFWLAFIPGRARPLSAEPFWPRPKARDSLTWTRACSIGRAKASRRPTSASRPFDSLPARLLTHLRRWRDKGISRQAVVEYEGKPVASVKKAFARAVADAEKTAFEIATKRGTAPPSTLKDVSPHVLRHTAITWAMQGGADTYDASDFFGVTRELIERTYGHHHPDHQKGVADALTRRPGAARLGTASSEQTMIIEAKRHEYRQ